MDIAALSLVLAAIFAWGIISARAAAISTPIFFVAVGLLMAESLKLIDLAPDPHATKIIAEVTLVWCDSQTPAGYESRSCEKTLGTKSDYWP